MSETRTRALTVTELDEINAASNYKANRVADKLEEALHLSIDAEKANRLAAHLCRGCFYVGFRFSGQAFTNWTCKLCPNTGYHPNTAVPRVCFDCCTSFGLCSECMGDIDMKRRTKFDRKAKRQKKGKTT